MKRNISLLIVIFIFSSFYICAQSQGEVLFKENKPKDAVKVLENEILNGIVSANTYNFLGLGYYQLGDYSKSIDAFNRGIKEQPSLSKLLTYNQGNTYYAMKDFTSAISCYTEVINQDKDFNEAYLNRANALLMANQLTVAKDEYVAYLEKNPNDIQRNKIEELIKALETEIARRLEEERLLAELEKAKWEEYDASLEEIYEDEDLIDWEKIDAAIPEENKSDEEKEDVQNDKENWESVEAKIPEEKENIIEEEKENWESFEDKIPNEEKKPEETTEWEQVDAPIKEDKKEEPGIDWEKVLFEKELLQNQTDNIDSELVIDDSEFENWQTLSDEDKDELKYLDDLSKEEHELWLAEQERIIREIENEKQRRELEEKLNSKVQKEKEEKELRDRIAEEMMKAENERKQKLLDDLANSLMNSESTNMSSGADDIMDYDLEGELD